MTWSVADCCFCKLFALRQLLFVTDQAMFEPLTHSYHSGTITGLDVCIRKPLAATCSLDHSVRVWNYETKYAN